MDNVDISYIRKHICDLIPNHENKHHIIDNFFTMNNIPRTINNNGKFINLSLLDDIIIIDLYKLIKTIIENKTETNNYEIKEEYILPTNHQTKNNTRIVKNKNIYKQISINNKIDKQIIYLSQFENLK